MVEFGIGRLIMLRLRLLGVTVAMAALLGVPAQAARAAQNTGAWSPVAGATSDSFIPTDTYCFTGPTDCLAAGESTSTVAGVEDDFSGTWQLEPASAPPPGEFSQTALSSISCTSRTFCVAVGWAETLAPDYVTEPLAATFDGASWTYQAVDVPGNESLQFAFSSISCVSSTRCVAVGSFDNGNDFSSSELAATFDGSSWTTTLLPNPEPSSGSYLFSVSCTDATDCVAVGYDGANMQSGEPQAFSEVLSASGWQTVLTAPAYLSTMFGVSCADGSCVAVGYQFDGTSEQPLIEDYSGGAWTIVGGGVPDGVLRSVACPTADDCAAVGEVIGTNAPIAMTTTGSGWSPQQITIPTAGTEYLGGLSCPSATYCVASGMGSGGSTDAGFLVSGGIATAPGSPTGVVAQAGSAPEQVSLSWTTPTSDGGEPITGYDVYVGTASGGEATVPVNSAPISGTSYTVGGLSTGVTYYFTVTAINAAGSSSPSNEATAAPPGIFVDQTTTVDGNSTVTTSPFSTGGARLLVAFVSGDGPAKAQSATVSGAGLTWTLAVLAHSKGGTAEIWSAYVPAGLTGATVTAKLKRSGYDESLTVIAFGGATGIGATASAGRTSGAPTVSVTTTTANSWVFGVGEDYTQAIAPSLPSGQMLIDQWVDSGPGETFWTQAQSEPTPSVGTTVKINDTAPTTDTWDLAAAEILPS